MNEVTPLMLSTFDVGGAASAALRLHHKMHELDINSTFLTYSRESDDETVTDTNNIISPFMRYFLRRSVKKNAIINRQNQEKGALYWSDNRRLNGLAWSVNRIPHNILHLHWIGMGFVPISAFRWFRNPIVWTLHDSWAFTGGCHVPLTCQRFEIGCGKCPQLGSSEENDESRQIFNAKRKSWHKQDFVIVSPSNWLAQRATSSPVLANKTVHVIPNGIDLDIFTPNSKRDSCYQLNLSPDNKYVVFGTLRAEDYNKGYDLFEEAINRISQQQSEFELILYGDVPADIETRIERVIHNVGLITSPERLRLVFAAADVLVLPSRQENLSNTLMEALASGTPCVAFDIGGNSDLVVHRENGYLATPLDTEDMANGILWVINNYDSLSYNARNRVEEHFDVGKITEQYLDLYKSLTHPH